jgi:hypothetical protein
MQSQRSQRVAPFSAKKKRSMKHKRSRTVSGVKLIAAIAI